MEVTIQDLPQGKVSVTNLMVGSPANLTVPMVVYPPPQKEDYTWVIQDNSTNTKIEVKPGIYIHIRDKILFMKPFTLKPVPYLFF